MAPCKVFNKNYNIAILFSKWGQNFDQKLHDNQTSALTTFTTYMHLAIYIMVFLIFLQSISSFFWPICSRFLGTNFGKIKRTRQGLSGAPTGYAN